MAFENDGPGMDDETITPAPESGDQTADIRQSDRELVKRILRTIREDKRHHEKAFKRMKRDMFVAMNGCEKEWGADKYRANIVGRHINQKTAQLYAKNPKAVARRRDTMDFSLWDENPQTLMMAYQGLQQLQASVQQMQAAGIVLDPNDQNVAAMQQQMQQAQAVIQDAQQGISRRQTLKKFGRTLEILFGHALREQNPLEFKLAMKQMARRTCTTGVGYIELGFQREYGPRPDDVNKLADFKSRLDHIRRLLEEVEADKIDDLDAEMAELERSIAALQNEPEILLREGLVFDFPSSTSVIPDKACRQLVGFVGAAHMTVQYLYTPEKVQEVFGIDVEKKFTPYQLDGKKGDGYTSEPYVSDENQLELGLEGKDKDCKDGFVCVWKHYDKPSGLVYYVADGYDAFLREPAAPDVFVDDFWPLRALTFNAVESEDTLFPPSDVSLLLYMQQEINRSREGLREHRQAARPRWLYPNGAIDEEDTARLQEVKPFDAIGMNIDPSSDVAKLFQAFPVPGVDPNLYETNPFFYDMQLVAGTQASQLGATSRGTATEAAIAEDSTATSSGSNVDDLDGFLTWVARSSGQVLMREMTPESVVRIAGPGAVWPGLGDMPAVDMEQVADEVFLEVEAGSSGKPNQAVEIRNWQNLLPYLLQMGSIPSQWLARETLRRLDDRMDLTEAVIDGLPSLVAQNQQAQPATGDAQSDPNQQAAQGGDKTAAPGGPSGSSAPMGNNQGI